MQQPIAISFQRPHVPRETEKNQRQEKVSYLEMDQESLEKAMNFYLPEKNEQIRKAKGTRGRFKTLDPNVHDNTELLTSKQ